MKLYIYQRNEWPQFTWNHEEIINVLGKVRHIQGKLLGKRKPLDLTSRKKPFWRP